MSIKSSYVQNCNRRKKKRKKKIHETFILLGIENKTATSAKVDYY